MNAEIHVIDAFTHKAFRGNPAAVCIPEGEPDAAWMQQVASEMRHSETAFLKKEPDGWSLRWFTPESEVDLCGHATLAAAFVLWNTGREGAGTTIRFKTRSGILTARNEGSSGIALDFPGVTVSACDPPEGISAALGGAPVVFSGRTKFDLFIELPTASDVCDMDPDLSLLASIPCRGIIVTAGADMPEYDFVSRFFAPSVGVAEDPVTGSAHCSLGPFWGERLKKSSLAGFQCSPRGGSVRVILENDRVVLVGNATPILSGRLLA
ncbi:MAG TPA: PhzF family phenazine biosynthesis protein [Methanoregulaceae archaeon]|nr:PhzF family phenazine biosynthesis protein [Methanoregulaceae archaeon]HRY76458.1 PhzF family phenazine biosynthesis protein [Methanoregulaceae archaeon]